MAWEEGGATGEVWSTFTTTKFNSDSNNFFHGIIMATGMTSDFALTPTAAGLTFIQSGVRDIRRHWAQAAVFLFSEGGKK